MASSPSTTPPTFNVQEHRRRPGQSALACQSNHNGKYAYVLTSPSRITIVNLLDPTERLFVENQEGGISGIGGIFSYVDEEETSSSTIPQRSGIQ